MGRVSKYRRVNRRKNEIRATLGRSGLAPKTSHNGACTENGAQRGEEGARCHFGSEVAEVLGHGQVFEVVAHNTSLRFQAVSVNVVEINIDVINYDGLTDWMPLSVAVAVCHAPIVGEGTCMAKRITPREQLWLSADEAALRLGISKATLYAYVSRGRVSREVGDDGRRSRFDAEEIASLASGRVRASRPGQVELRIGTAITRLDEASLSYRGDGIDTIIGFRTFEQVAELLWQQKVPSWKARTAAKNAAAQSWAAAGIGREAALRPGVMASVLAQSVLAIGATDDYRADLRPEAVVAAATQIISALSESLPGVRVSDRTVAERIWRHCTRSAPGVGAVALVDGALASLADHELATSTFAVRVAASTRTDPYAAVAAGMCVLAGPLHGSASGPTYSLLQSAHDSGRPARALGESLAQGPVPGFGHKVYRGTDPRCTALLALLDRADVDRGRRATVHSVLDEAATRVPKAPNVDFALAAIAYCCGLPPSSGELIFGISRIVGWVSHYLEELEEPVLRYRARATYRGR